MTTGPLTNTVLMGVDPQHAAAASGAVNTAQEGGAAVGVAIVGTVFYPALGSVVHPASYAHALQVSLIPLMAFGFLAALIAQLLPAPPRPETHHSRRAAAGAPRRPSPRRHHPRRDPEVNHEPVDDP